MRYFIQYNLMDKSTKKKNIIDASVLYSVHVIHVVLFPSGLSGIAVTIPQRVQKPSSHGTLGHSVAGLMAGQDDLRGLSPP